MRPAGSYVCLLRDILAAASVESSTSFSWFGRRVPRLPRRITHAIAPEMARDYLVSALTQTLYRNAYCSGFAVPERDDQRPPRAQPGRTPFIEALSAANCGTGFWDGGWTLRAVENDTVELARDGLILRARREDCRTRNGQIEPGLEAAVPAPKERLGISPGFYMALSDVEFRFSPGERLVRLYWHVTETAAVPLMRRITAAMNGAGLPFLFKIANAPQRFARCDAAVLYVARRDRDLVFPLLGQIHDELLGGIEEQTPAFTKRLLRGLALAEDPPGEESFGQHRCRLVADAIVRARERGLRQPEARLELAVARFAAEGLRLDQPYLNPGSIDDYVFPARTRRAEHARAASAQGAAQRRNLGRGSRLHTAIAIGRHLCREAIWWGDRCNWLGAVGKDPRLAREPGLSHGALGPNVYDGSAGISLFLAELGRLNGDKEVCRTAVGGIGGALHVFEGNVLPDQRRGLYAGRIGVACAAAHIGRLLGQPSVEEGGLRLALRMIGDQAVRREYDLLQGHAGEIVGLLALFRHFGESRFRSAAIRVGEGLIGAAHLEDGRISWGGLPRWPDLVGFAHGTAGVAYGLLELFQAVGDPRLREAALGAFEYERNWFDAEARNWPDLTAATRKKRKPTDVYSFLPHWCHGAPGIAVSRLHAHSLLKLEALKTEALVALDTTEHAIQQWLERGGENFSVCHGLAGNADVLSLADNILGKAPQRGSLIDQVASEGIQKYDKTGAPWPCGAGEQGTQTPSLFLGMAGIGYFYLRLYDETVPSLLTWGSVSARNASRR